VGMHHLFAKDHGKEFVVRDVLDQRRDDVSRFLESCFIIPVGVDLVELLCNEIMLSDEESMCHCKNGLLVHAGISGEEAVDIFTRSDAALIGFLKLQRKKILHVELLKDGKCLHQTILVKTERFKSLGDVRVDGTGIDGCRNLIELFSWSKATVITETSLRADEVHASTFVERVEVIIFRDLDGKTIRMGSTEAAVATLGSFIGSRILGLCGERDIVINKLTPCDEEDGNGVVMEAFVSVHVGGDKTGRRKGMTSYRRARGRNTISVIWRKEAMVSVHGSAPMRMFEVVAETLDGPVPLNVALGSHQERWTELLDGALGCVNQRKPVGNGILRQLVLLGEVSSSFVDNCPEIADVVTRELAFDGGKTNTFLGGSERFVDSGVGDAGVLVGWPERRRSSWTRYDQGAAGLLRRRRSGMMRRRGPATETVETVAPDGK